MESRTFIKLATALRSDIKTFAAAYLSDEDARVQGDALQKRINTAFVGLQNPTLPSATGLCAEALEAGFIVNPTVIHRLHQHEGCWQ